MHSEFVRNFFFRLREAKFWLALFGFTLFFGMLNSDPLNAQIKDVSNSIKAGDSSIQLRQDLYQFDETASLEVKWAEVGNEISVYVDDAFLGDFAVRSAMRFLQVPLPEPAEVGSFLYVFDSAGMLAFTSPVMRRTYLRGNVVEAGSYGDNEPDLIDLVFLSNHVSNGGPAPAVLGHGDVDNNGVIDDQDVELLIDHLAGGSSYPEPRRDVLYDGTLTNVRTQDVDPLPAGFTAIAPAQKHCPPNPGDGAQPIDLDGNPNTKEWWWPGCVVPVPGEPDKATALVAYGPRDPSHVPDGGNSNFEIRLYCVDDTNPNDPDVTHKVIGQCVYPNGQNTTSTGNGQSVHTCTNRTPADGPVGASHTWTTDFATCLQELCIDFDGDGICDFVKITYLGN